MILLEKDVMSSAIGWYLESAVTYAKYAIAYDVSDGSGALSSQTKIHGTGVTISNIRSTRTGYTFKGWTLTKADADDWNWYYSSGSTCGKNKNLTLYTQRIGGHIF